MPPTRKAERPKSGFWGPKKEIILPVNQKHGFGYDKTNKFWYLSYHVGGKIHKEIHRKAKSVEDIREIRQRRFTEMLLEGATLKNLKKNQSRRKAPNGVAIYKFVVKTPDKVRYQVRVDGKRVGKPQKTLALALVSKNKYLRENPVSPCQTCGKIPHIILGRRDNPGTARLVHTDCLNACEIPRGTRTEILEIWNHELRIRKYER